MPAAAGFRGLEGLVPNGGIGFFFGQQIVVIHFDPECILDMIGFGLDEIVDVDVPVDNFDFVPRAADEAFDIIFDGIGGIFEDDHIPDFGIDELVDIFHDQDAVSAAGLEFDFGIGLVVADRAGRADAGTDPVGGDIDGIGRNGAFVKALLAGAGDEVIFGIEAEMVFVSAGGAGEVEMSPAQGIGHAAGGDDEGFDHKGPEDKGQDKGDDQGFDGFLEGVEGAFSVGSGLRMGHNQILLSFSVIFGQYINQPVEIFRK